MSIYSWPVSLIKDIEKWIKNFIWSGDVSKRKLITVAWEKVCSDYDEDGLGIRSLLCLNEATILKICWELLHSEEKWASLLRDRVLRTNSCVSHHIFSSIWSGIKNEYKTVMDNSNWLLGNGHKIKFWIHNWCGVVHADHFHLTANIMNQLPQKVSNYITNSQWNISEEFLHYFANLMNLVSQVTLPLIDKNDELIWNQTASGNPSLKEAFLFKQPYKGLLFVIY